MYHQIIDYDEFNIYTTIEDVKNYIISLIQKGYDSREEIYNMCLEYFGQNYISIIEDLMNDED
jgi:hypothetical protein